MAAFTVMLADPPALQAQPRVKRKIFFVTAGMILAIPVVRFLVSGTFIPTLALVQLVWGLSYVLLGVCVGAGVLVPWLAGILAAMVCVPSVTAIIHFTGGPASPFFVTIVCAPLLIALFAPDSRLPTLVSLGGMLVAVIVLNEVVVDVAPGLPKVRLGQRYLVQVLVNVVRTGGTLTAENRPEGGARFVLTLMEALEITSAAA